MIRAKVTAKGQLTIPKTLIEKELDEKRFDKYIGFLNRETKSDEIIRELRDQ